jgi:hypothetical protein
MLKNMGRLSLGQTSRGNNGLERLNFEDFRPNWGKQRTRTSRINVFQFLMQFDELFLIISELSVQFMCLKLYSSGICRNQTKQSSIS